jgi:hypothetical protein
LDINNKIFALSLRILYEIDVIEEDAILEWYYDERSKGDVKKPEIYSKLRDVVYFDSNLLMFKFNYKVLINMNHHKFHF